MSCKEKHAWQEILSFSETDYEPGYTAWWCKHCGDAAVQRHFDGRVMSNIPYRVEPPKEAQEKAG